MEESMTNTIRLNKYIKCDGFSIKRIYPKKQPKLLEELTALYIKNKEHLFYWHGGNVEFDFKKPDDYASYLSNYNCMGYVILISGKIIGFIGITRISKRYTWLKGRYITYWIDKDHARQGIMYKALSALEESMRLSNTEYLKANVYVDNKASIGLLEKLNFKRIVSFNFFVNESSTIGKDTMADIEYKKSLKRQVA